MTLSLNPITDLMSLKGIKVAHWSSEEFKTGVTTILPRSGEEYVNRLAAGFFRLNGAGELTGTHQIKEWGILETPIVLTNSFSTGAALSGVQQWMKKRYPKMGIGSDVSLPIVGECDDSHTSQAPRFVVTSDIVKNTLDRALKAKKMSQGRVGAGRGTRTFGIPGGLGSAGFELPKELGGFKVAVLLQSNFGLPHQSLLKQSKKGVAKRDSGSVIVVVATDAPLLPGDCERLAKRACLGLARTGSTANQNSGELALAFSTGVHIPRQSKTIFDWPCVRNEEILNALFEATVLATEAAVKNAIL